MNKVYLSERNLLSLLSKLERKKRGESTFCTIVKSDVGHAVFPCTDQIEVIAVLDEEYYTDRNPGTVHRLDDPSGGR